MAGGINWRSRSIRRVALAVVLVVIALALYVPVRMSGVAGGIGRARAKYQGELSAINGGDIFATIEELSSERYEGRQAGSPGGRKAAEYIAEQFRSIGLQPLSGSSYFQEFRIAYSHPAEAPVARLHDQRGKDMGTLKYGQDIAYSIWSDSADIHNAPVVFVGSWDRIGDLDLAGKVALAVRPGGEATLKSLYDGLEKARAAGALALLAADFDGPTMTAYWDVDTVVPGIAMVGLGSRATDTLLSRTGKDTATWIAELAAAAKAGQPFAAIDTGLRLDLKWAIDNDRERVASNVVGIIPGTRGIEASRTVLLTAHYDHLGAIPSGPVWPGAWDNSSGVAVMLGAASMLANTQPDINIIVAAWDAEERGLVGSAYFARNLPVAQGNLIGIINLDCVGARLDFSLERTPSGPLARRLVAAGRQYKIEMIGAPVKPWSDAASFESIGGVQAIQIFDAGNPYEVPFLHDPSDTTANLRPDALERLARTVALAIVAESEAQTAR